MGRCKVRWHFIDVYGKAIFGMWLLFHNPLRNPVMLLFSCLEIIFALPFDSRSTASAAPCTVPLCLCVQCWEAALFWGTRVPWGHSCFVKSLRQRRSTSDTQSYIFTMPEACGPSSCSNSLLREPRRNAPVSLRCFLQSFLALLYCKSWKKNDPSFSLSPILL